jgi:tryptophan halogenase
MHHWPERSDPTHTQIPVEKSLEWVRERRQQLAAAVATVPTHEDYLKHILAR